MAEVTELTPSNSGKPSDSPPPESPGVTTSAPRFKAGRPPNGARRPPEARQPQFFEKVASVPKEDWGARAFMYVYVDEPCCNPKTFGESRYLLKSSVPILDLEGLKQDYGSFKGWMSLNLRKTGKAAPDEVNRLSFEIYDPKNPPKIPRGAWANDARNKRWLDLLPPEPPPASAAASSLLEGARFYKDIREELKEEMAPTEPTQTRTSEVLETMKAAKDLFGPAAATGTAAKDPLEIAVALATTMMQMKADNPVIDMYRDELKALREEMKEERAASRLAAPPVAAKSFLDQALELAQNADKLEPLKKMLGFGGGEVTGRAARTTGMDILNNLVSGPAGTMLAQGLGTLLVNLPRMFTPAEGTPGQGQPPPQPIVLPPPGAPPTQMPETPEQKLQRIGMTVTEPMLYEFFLRGATGDVWADRMNDLWPNDFAFVKGIGPDVLVNHYRQTRAWMLIAPKETEFKQFMAEFCTFDPTEGTDQPEDESGI